MERNHRLFFILCSAICLLVTGALLADRNEGSRGKTDPAAAAILDRYVAAIGGYAAWDEVANIRIVTEIETFGIKRKSVRIEEPKSGRFHTVSTGPEGDTVTGFDGTAVWRRSAWSHGVLAENDAQGRLMKTWRERQLRNWRNSKTGYRISDPVTVEGTEYLVIETTERDEGDLDTMVRYFFHPETHLLERTVRGNVLQSTSTFFDYRSIGKVRIPFQTVTENPQFRSLARIIDWAANVELSPSIFTFEQQPEGPAAAELEGVDLSKARVFRSGDANLPPEVAKMVEEARAQRAAGDGPVAVRKPLPSSGAISTEQKLEAFDTVWKTINETYWDPSFGGADWKAIGDTYRAKIVAAEGSADVHELLNEMVNQLGQTHFRVLGPDRTRTLGSNRPLPGTLGMSYRGIDGQLVVTKVEEGGAAAEAGIEKGFVITGVNGKPVSELHATLLEREPVLAVRPDAALQRAIAPEVSGDPGGVVEIELLDHDDRKVTKNLVRAERKLSAMNVEFESRWLEDGTIGYVRIGSFIGNAAERLATALEEMRTATTIILDLRGNGGGAGDLAPTIAGMFAREAGSLGVSRFRHGTRSFDYTPASNAFTGELIILVDDGSASTSEVFAGGLQESGRARVIGSTTRGAVLPSLMAPLPTGGALQHVISDFRTPKGIVLEGRGVVPDIAIAVRRADLIAGRDPVLARALTAAKEWQDAAIRPFSHR